MNIQQNHPCYVMVVCNNFSFINILTIHQYNYITNVMIEDSPYFYFENDGIKMYEICFFILYMMQHLFTIL